MFPGAELLDTCVVELPLTYAKKDKERYTQAARFLEGEELVYAVRDKKTKKMNCTRVFVVVELSKDSTEVRPAKSGVKFPTFCMMTRWEEGQQPHVCL